jgi:hypothetical protein
MEGWIRGRAGPELVALASPERIDALAVLDQWRALVFGPAAEAGPLPTRMVYLGREFLRRAGSDLGLLGALAKFRVSEHFDDQKAARASTLAARVFTSIVTTTDERELLIELAGVCAPLAGEHVGAVARATAGLAASGKVVVFSEFDSVCAQVRTMVSRTLDPSAVVAVGTMNQQQSAASAHRFLHQDDCRVLICPPSARQGLNLQSARFVVHADLPWSVLQMEQRIGRADRYAEGDPVRSVVFVNSDDSATLHDAWIVILRDGFEVFQHSIADLQHAVEAENVTALRTALVGGAPELLESVASLADRIAATRLRIDHLETLDAIAADRTDTTFGSEIQRVDNAHAEFAEATSERARRYGFPLTAVDGKATRILQPSVTTERQTILRDLVGEGLTFERGVAVKHPGTRLLRVGEPLVEMFRQEAARDLSGRTWLCWRGSRKVRPEDENVFFCFDLRLVNSSPEVPRRVTAPASVEVQRQQRCLPTTIHRVWIALSGDIPPERAKLLLDAADEQRDLDVDGDEWPLEHLITAADWPEMCRQAAGHAARIAIARRAERQAQRGNGVEDVLASAPGATSTARQGNGTLDDRAMMNFDERASMTVSQIKAVIESAGAVYLSPNPPKLHG